ncbi:FAD binding domain-containing protein [Anoxynatronum sibiricum]|uniref:FAD binding domain-containing protein n=1 Tax=Anoxynatronum sibiricum TaxID=210623 RepID=A0ABU9VXS9_9CLOT
MITVKNVITPSTTAEAFEALQQNRFATLLGGGAFLRMGSKNITTLIDLSRCGLHCITEHDDHWEIGAAVTLGELEQHRELNRLYAGLPAAAVREIVGVQLRNVVTVGASVYARYGFSDLITGLLALPVKVRLHQAGEMPLETFLEQGAGGKDVLEAITIEKESCRSGFASLRKTAGDYALLNAAAAVVNGKLRISVGARPRRAALAHSAMAFLKETAATLNESSQMIWTEEVIQQAAETAAGELVFGTNSRSTSEYRQHLCRVLVARVLRACNEGGGRS